MCRRGLLVVQALLIGAFFSYCANAQDQLASDEWKDNPYRSFIGSWCGKIVESKDKMPPEVGLTIVEEKDKARMRWNYVFGVSGHKGYDQATKYVVMSPKLGKMMMHFGPGAEKLYEAPDLAAFARSGYGKFTATIRHPYSNYFHIRKVETDAVTFDVEPDALSYVWHRYRGDKDEIYSDFQLKRIQAGERCN